MVELALDDLDLLSVSGPGLMPLACSGIRLVALWPGAHWPNLDLKAGLMVEEAAGRSLRTSGATGNDDELDSGFESLGASSALDRRSDTSMGTGS